MAKSRRFLLGIFKSKRSAGDSITGVAGDNSTHNDHKIAETIDIQTTTTTPAALGAFEYLHDAKSAPMIKPNEVDSTSHEPQHPDQDNDDLELPRSLSSKAAEDVSFKPMILAGIKAVLKTSEAVLKLAPVPGLDLIASGLLKFVERYEVSLFMLHLQVEY